MFLKKSMQLAAFMICSLLLIGCSKITEPANDQSIFSELGINESNYVTVTLADLINNPDHYNNTKIKITGVYSISNETSILIDDSLPDDPQLRNALWIFPYSENNSLSTYYGEPEHPLPEGGVQDAGKISNFMTLYGTVLTKNKYGRGDYPHMLWLDFAIYLDSNTRGIHQIPSPILKKYAQMEREYNESMGAHLRRCVHADTTVYLVIGSGGYSGITYYYDKNGEKIGSYSWDDVVWPNEPKPPVDLDAYVCTNLRQSVYWKWGIV